MSRPRATLISHAPGFTRRQRLGVDHLLGLRCERRGEHDEVRLAEELGQRLRPADAVEHRLAEREVVDAPWRRAAPPFPSGRRRTATTRQPNAVASAPTARPIEPSPTMPTVTSRSSVPSSGCQVRSRCSSRSCGSRRDTARIIINTYSAIGRLNTPRALVTIRPRSARSRRQRPLDPDVAEWTHASSRRSRKQSVEGVGVEPAAEHDLDVVERAVGQALDRDRDEVRAGRGGADASRGRATGIAPRGSG